MAKVTIDIDAVDNASQVIKKTGLSLTDFKSGVDMVTTALAGMYEMGKKAYDIGKLGAQVTQTKQSFDKLTEAVGAQPGLLNALREASNNTIDDMKLMSSTTTLLAGAQGELATGLANATPKLLEIAKAANELNPTLGDTSFMYESLALGIKRASPMILDNLGLTIKIGEANQKMADSLGKAVEELTAEEQKMALLNATLEAGNVLIEQAGGAADSATDNFARFEAGLKNYADTVREQAYPAVSEFAGAMADLMDQAAKNAALQDLTKGMSDAERGAYLAKLAAMGANEADKHLIKTRKNLTSTTEDLAEANDELMPSVKKATQANILTRDAAASAARAYDDYWRKVKDTQKATEDLEAANLDLALAQQNFADGAGNDFASVLQSQYDALPEWQKPANEMEEGLRIIDEVMGTNTLSQYEMAASQEELARQFAAGELSAEQFREKLEGWESTWEPFNEDVEEAQRKIAYLQDMLDRLEGTYHINIEVSGAGGGAGGSVGDQERNYNVDLNGNGIIGARSGLDNFMVPPGYDETAGRPFLVAASSGETINVDPNGRKGSAGNTYNLTIRTTQSPRVVQRGFALERALAGV